MAVILSHTHLSVCSVMLTLRASPSATPPSTSILFPSRLFRQHENTEFYPHNYVSHILNKYNDQCGNLIIMCSSKDNNYCYGYCQVRVVESQITCHCHSSFSSTRVPVSYWQLQELHCGCHSKSHLPQCLQCHVDFEGFSQRHTSFNFNSISIKTAFRQHENTEFYPHNYVAHILNKCNDQCIHRNLIIMCSSKDNNYCYGYYQV